MLRGLHTTRPLADDRVEDMNDGGMGRVRIVGESYGNAKFGRIVAEATWRDSDGAFVSIAVNVDQYGRLSELDIWKVDFSPLCDFPQP